MSAEQDVAALLCRLGVTDEDATPETVVISDVQTRRVGNVDWQVLRLRYGPPGDRTRYLVAYAVCPGLDSLRFSLSRRSLADRIFAFATRDRLRFPGHPDFEKRYQVIGRDTGRLEALFSAEVVERLERLETNVCVEAEGATFLTYVQTRSDDADAFLTDSVELADAIRGA